MEPIKLIKHALNATIAGVKAGNTPTDSLMKVSRELDLNPNYIQRTGEALNVALTYDHFKKNANDKSADFNIADTGAVTKEIFGEKEKTLAQKKAEWFPEISETIDYNKILTNPGFKKKASEIKDTDAKHSSFPITYKGQFKKAQDHMSRLDRELDEIKTEKVANDIYVEGAFFALVNSFKKEASARTSFDEFESQVFAEHGERAIPYVDLVYKSAGISDARGAHDDKYINFKPSHETKLFNSFLKAASDKVAQAVELKEAEDYVNSQKREFQQIGYNLNPMAQAFDKAACEDLADTIEIIEKEAGDRPGIIDLISKFHSTMTGQDAPKPAFPNTKRDDQERISILQELVMTDPILKKIDPRKILQSYQQILRLSPQITKEKQVLASHLRAMTAAGDGALHATDASQLLDANSSLMKQQQMFRQTEGGAGKDKK